MASITFSELNAIHSLDTCGLNLLNDTESFLNDLSTDEQTIVQGGLSPLVVTTVAVNSWWFVGGAALGGAGAIGLSIYNGQKK